MYVCIQYMYTYMHADGIPFNLRSAQKTQNPSVNSLLFEDLADAPGAQGGKPQAIIEAECGPGLRASMKIIPLKNMTLLY